MLQDVFDEVILTQTSRDVSSMKFNPCLPYNKTYALNSFHFMHSVKVFLAFNIPFWANDTKIPAIPFDSSTTMNGGSGITDLPIRNIYYPSHPFHGYSILEIHREMANTTYKEGKIIKWMEEDWTAGAFAWAYPGQIHAIEPALRESHMADMLQEEHPFIKMSSKSI